MTEKEWICRIRFFIVALVLSLALVILKKNLTNGGTIFVEPPEYTRQSYKLYSWPMTIDILMAVKFSTPLSLLVRETETKRGKYIMSCDPGPG